MSRRPSVPDEPVDFVPANQDVVPASPESAKARRSRRVAAGGTAVAALVFLVFGALSWRVSAGVGAMLVVYGLLVAAVAAGGWRGLRWASGPMVFLGLLHLLVGLSMAGRQHGYLALCLLALVTVAAGVSAHLAEIRRSAQL